MKSHEQTATLFSPGQEVDLRPQPNNELDGVEFINIYTKAKTELGKKLSHFSHTPFTHPLHGTFYTLEGFWHWYKSIVRPDQLRYMNGPKARDLGKKLECEWRGDFKDAIFIATFCKIEQNPDLKAAFLKTELPFDHYYLHGPRGQRITIRPPASLWLCEMMQKIRTMMWNGERPELLEKHDPRPEGLH